MWLTTLVLNTLLAAAAVGPVSSQHPSGKWREPRSSLHALLPGTGVHDTGLLTVAVDDVGGQEAWHSTFFWPDTASLDNLYWSFLAVGLGQWSVVDAWDFEWQTTPGGSLVMLEPGPLADEEGLAEFADASGSVRVRQHSYAWGTKPDQDYIIVAYTVVNTSGAEQDSLLIAHRTDFDVLGDHGMAMTDKSGFDSTRMLAYMWDSTSTVHAGVSLLSGIFRGYHTGWRTFNDSDKYYIMDLPGADPTTPSWDDYCIWLSAGPYRVPAGDSVEVVFAFLMGESLPDLQANADQALARLSRLSLAETRPVGVETCMTATICRGVLWLPPATSHKSQSADCLLDIGGRKAMALRAGANDVSRLSPGVYFVSEARPQTQAKAGAVHKIVVTK
jgi:hypothetical protein